MTAVEYNKQALFSQATISIKNKNILCKDCTYFSERRVAAVCNHPNGLKNPDRECYCCFAEYKRNQQLKSI